jgi:DNA-binding transcriptional ArsR family regulator
MSDVCAAFPFQPTVSSERPPEPHWTLLTNHAHVLLCLARQPDIRQIELAAEIGIRERTVNRILTELEAAGYINRERQGRTVRYAINREAPFRRAGITGTVGDLLDLVGREGSARTAARE